MPDDKFKLHPVGSILRRINQAAGGGIIPIGSLVKVAGLFNDTGYFLEYADGPNMGQPCVRPDFSWSKMHWELVEQPAPKRTMDDVKVGDKVRRVKDEHMGMEVGDVDVVREVPLGGGSIGLKTYGGFHDRNKLELVVEPEAEPAAQPQPEVVMPYQFKVGDTGKTRGGKLYRVVANDIATETKRCVLALIKKDADALNETVLRAHINGRLYVDMEDASDLLPPKIKLYQVTASHRTRVLEKDEVAEEAVYITVLTNKPAADLREKELKEYYKEVIQSVIERDQK